MFERLLEVRNLLWILAPSILSSAALAAPKLSSTSTGLYPSKACKTKHAGGEGEDPVLRCPALKGFDVEVSFAAVETFVTLTGKGTNKTEIKFSGLVGNKLEWRLADKTPYAVLVEVADSDTDDNGRQIAKNPRIEIEGLGIELHDHIAIKGSDKKAAWAAARALADAARPK